MDKRFFLGLFLLILLLVLSLMIQGWMASLADPISRSLEQAQALARAGAWPEAQALAARARYRWQRSRSLAAVVADQTPMDELEQLFAEMTVFGQHRNTEHFSACCLRLSLLCTAMADAHEGSWWNLF